MRFSIYVAALAVLVSGLIAPSIGHAQSSTGFFGKKDAPPALPADGPPPLPADGPPPLPQLSYYIGVDGQKVGPLDTAGLKARVASGALTESTLVWTKGMENWDKAATRKDLMALMIPVPSPTPAPQPGPAPTGFDAAKFVVGNWATEGTTIVPELGNATITGRETFGADGRYTGVSVVTIAKPPAQLSQMGLTGALILDVKMDGTYRIVSQSGRNYTIEVTGTIAISDRNNLGLKNSEKSTETIKYLSLDDNTFKDTEDDIIARRAN